MGKRETDIPREPEAEKSREGPDCVLGGRSRERLPGRGVEEGGDGREPKGEGWIQPPRSHWPWEAVWADGRALGGRRRGWRSGGDPSVVSSLCSLVEKRKGTE